MNANRAAGIVFIVLAAVLATLLFRVAGPEPRPANAPAADFSAGRAIAVLRTLLGDEQPHPVGTAANEAVLGRLTRQFEAIGYQPRLQSSFACSPEGACAPVTNVVAELPGDPRAEVLVVTAHYDSVPAGPGASDDGVGVATVVETARAIRQQRFRNTVRFLITDGEEAGLLGAEAVAHDATLLRRVGCVINVENRGTAGPSFLFETSAHNLWLIPIVARSLPRPATSSLFYEVYRLLPNDTDLTVYKRLGLAGINFAAIGQVAHYHTPLDRLANVTPSLVQDHGDHVLAMTRALANADLRQSTDDNAVFFDVLSLFTMWWPQRWTMSIALTVLAMLVVGGGIRIRAGYTTVGGVLAGVVSFLASVAIAALLAAVVMWMLSLRAAGAMWSAQPGPSIAAAWLIGIGCAVAVSTWMIGRAGFDGLFIGHAVCWAALGVSLARVLPGVSFIAIVPAAAFAVSVFLSAVTAADVAVGSIICAAVTAVIHFPFGLLFYDAFGRPAIVAIAVVLALASTTFAPIVAAAAPFRRAAMSSLFATALVCVAMQLAIRPFTPESPRRDNVRYVDDGARVEWEADVLSPALRALSFDRTLLRLPWVNGPSVVGARPAQRLTEPAPEAVAVSRQQHHLVIRMRSPRGADRVGLIFHTSRPLASISVNGVPLPAAPHRNRGALAAGWRRVSVRAAEALVDLELQSEEPIDAYVSDFSYGLPPEAARYAQARNASLAVPSGDGDGVLIMRRVHF